METKKTPEADLENKRTAFFLMGLTVALSAFYVLLEWKSGGTDYSEIPALQALVFIENEFNMDMPTYPATVPEKQPPTVYEDYKIVENVLPEEPAKQDTALNNQSPDAETLELEPQTDEQKADETEAEADEAPLFPGGNVALARFIYSRIQYPQAALQQRIQGRVWCSFMVDRNGTVSDVALEKGVYVFLDEEAVRVLEAMPPWIPGKTHGKNVKVKVYLPIVFKI
ncbi:MAG: TonB family protein [Dysgonamonadaceae bacterium]|jgi:protein TonB|nr:TonB family protein [Dysgonamonadaceae bacterium]